MDQVQASASNHFIELRFWDKDNLPTIPSTATYTIEGREDPDDAWVEIRGSTAIGSLAATVDLQLESTDTELSGAGPVEYRRLCLYVDSSFYRHYHYEVVASECA